MTIPEAIAKAEETVYVYYTKGDIEYNLTKRRLKVSNSRSVNEAKLINAMVEEFLLEK